jgi:stress response protein YsnF
LVRVRKIVHEETAHVDEAVREERVSVERVPVHRLAEGTPGVRHEGDVMIVPVLEERLVVEKRLFIVEELRITRQASTRSEPQELKLRREEVVVERLDPRTQEWTAIDSGLQPTGSAPTGPRTGRSDALADSAAPKASSLDASSLHQSTP